MAIERAPTVGNCIAGWHGSVALIDPHAPVMSGDLCRVIIDYQSGHIASVIKFIELDSHGRWWIACDDGALQLGRYITPRVVQKVVGKEPALMSLDHVPVSQPSAHTFEVGRRRLEELRADQAAHGRRVGVPFPVAELTVPTPFGRTPEVMHATLPESSVQQPEAPLNFTLEVIGNLINLDWDRPEVHPVGTQYLIYAAPWSLSDVASKELLWSGGDEGKTLAFSATSAWWLQIRSQHGSYYSAFVPNTFGVGALPVYTPPTSTGAWGFDVSPAGVNRVANLGSLTTAPISAIVTNSVGVAVFSWYNPNSIDLKINHQGSASTTFTGSSMAPSEYRGGMFWIAINDGGNVSSKSFQVSCERDTGM